MSYSELLKKNRLKKTKVEYLYCIEAHKFVPVLKMEELKPVGENEVYQKQVSFKSKTG